jgi:NADPH:quinone reductase-like Zn-dependent oxidoreductase
VLVRVKASAINYRDLGTVRDPAARGLALPLVPNSDGAGEVVEIGPGVTRFAPGDRVAGTFFQRWIDGAITPATMASSLGGPNDGMLREFACLHEDGLVAVPDHLSDREAATLPCAGLTAWNALVEQGGIKAGDTVLLLGTGGVSIMALQFVIMHGARAVITSSSDAKLARAAELGAWQTVNYRDVPDWDQAVLEHTGGRGVDIVVEVGGAGTLGKSVAASRLGGTVALIGVLTRGEFNPMAVLRKSVRLQGVYVGNRRMFEDMNAAVSAHEMRPVIDQSFAFDDARAAYQTMAAASHFAKLVIDV